MSHVLQQGQRTVKMNSDIQLDTLKKWDHSYLKWFNSKLAFTCHIYTANLEVKIEMNEVETAVSSESKV